VLPPTRGKLCVTTDSVVEGVHFRTPPFTLEDVGYKALAVNLSDLAAMGAYPRWFLCAIAMPRAFGAREVKALASGMSSLARGQRIALAGGNFTSARELSITITAAGTTRKPLLRSGGHPGDLLYVSGTLGDARLGLEPGARLAARRKQRRPQPRVDLGLLASRFASAAIDLSDGLAQDLRHLCDASGTGAEVRVDLLPRSLADEATALAGGEDYELLLAIPPTRQAAFERACAAAREKVTRIGHLGGAHLRFLRGTHPIPPPPGFDHFRPAVHFKSAPPRPPSKRARPRI